MKRLVICADGSWNTRDQVDKATGKRRPSNVTKLARAVLPRDNNGISQIVFYDDGVGTHGGLDKWTGGAFGEGVEQNIRELYRFIVYNYEPGDELFLFGFSRGAFTARSLAGFMNVAGLLTKEGDYFVPDIYDCYNKNQGPGTPEWEKVMTRVSPVPPCPPITFIGVWDTVGALGAPGLLGRLFPNKYRHHDVTLNDHVQHACQALAIDERRKPFIADIWQRPAQWGGTLEQVWFAGTHTNVGGGFSPDGLANIALHWMVDRAESFGLAVDHDYLAHFRPCWDSKFNDSLSLFYRLMGNGERTIGANAANGEAIHRSALSRRDNPPMQYAPANLSRALTGGGLPPILGEPTAACGGTLPPLRDSDVTDARSGVL